LDLVHGGLGAEGFRRLLASPHLRSLTTLRVVGNSIGTSGISALFDAVSLNSLVELDLSESRSYYEDSILDATGLEALVAWPGMAQLRALILYGNNVGRDGLRALLRSHGASGLTHLSLRGNGLNGQAMEEFGGARPELQLDVLDLGENVLGDLGA